MVYQLALDTNERTHTHTHTYIYIYIYNDISKTSLRLPRYFLSIVQQDSPIAIASDAKDHGHPAVGPASMMRCKSGTFYHGFWEVFNIC